MHANWKTWRRHLFLKGKATKPALMPTFSARLSPKSHFPGPNTGIVFGLFLIVFKIN
uniref:Uncharacterized protein n=1 Tax=Podoviridae sp. ct3k57 TaxID=2825217 RepID=A0A8S5Q0J2_9CAUD|nr:MAG TPA: hypothetical protein [Podoviridae sp. ct3k57]